jgi:hypothetical protein
MTTVPAYQLAQVNIGRILAPTDSEQLSGFMNALDSVNALAEAADGFVWRLEEYGGNATDLRVFGDDWLLVNMSVWRDPESLTAYVFSPEHRAMLARRREWFARATEAMTALWWVPAGHRPTVAEAEAKLLALRADGPTADVFTLRGPQPAPHPAP